MVNFILKKYYKKKGMIKMENVNQIQLFTNSVFGEVRAVKIEDKVWFVGRDAVKSLGYETTTTSYTYYINKFVKEKYKMKMNNYDLQLFGMTDAGRKGEILIDQYGIIQLVMNSSMEEAEQFQDWILEEVIPSVLTTGTYSMKQDSYMIEDPIERAKRWIEEEEVRRQLELDNQEKQKLIEKQEERIQEQETEIVHKEDVIISLTQDVSIAEKRQRINDIVRYGAKGRYSERWSLLYKEFDSKFHINTKVRLERAKERGEVLKSTTRMDYICDVLNLTNELFDLCTVVFEADYIDMLENYLSVAKRNK